MSDLLIPASLTELDQWGVWRREHETKVPYSITGMRASSVDPSTWASFEDAAAEFRRHPRHWAGLAWFFCDSDPFVGIDLDDCLDGSGNPKLWARGIIERFADSYMEISPSGRGIKIWAKGSLPANLGKVQIDDGGIEMYSRARFFAVTGRTFRGAVLNIEDHTKDIAELYSAMARARGRWKHSPDAAGRIPHGRQHFALVSIAGTLARRGVCTEAIEACLQVVNERQCEQPGPRENISRIARSSSLWLSRREAAAS